MKISRGARIVLGLLFLVLFAAYSYLKITSFHAIEPSAAGAAPTEAAAPAGSGNLIPAGQETSSAPEKPGASEAPAEPTPTPEPTVDPESPYGKALANAAAKGLPAPPDIDVGDPLFVLVNGDHSIDRYEPQNLAYLNKTLSETDIQYEYNDQRCPVDAGIAEPLLAFCQGCKDAGLQVYLVSGYRSYETQVGNFRRVCEKNGVSDGKDHNGHYITMPAGCSEHQTALCCDITDKAYASMNASIENTQTYQWLVAHCAEYGFIQRFPAGKEDITGVMYEPWHFRYTGEEVAAYIMDNELCLEEFLALYGVE